ncbi:MAG TPA: replication initiator [Mycobacterium sp.]|nr:replication initiator [Mycobacterium sp.]HTX94618.1 replication initiator [Mycobacterium sp.]
MTFTPSHTPAAGGAAAITIPVLPGVPAGVDSTDVVVQMVHRAASPGFESWWRKAENVGFCANPIHLIGTDTSGRAHQVLSRCNNRRAVACPSCSDLYARDTWQLVHAGLHGGHHDMPSTVAEHPQVFVTLTAPGFGPVHTIRDDTHNSHDRRCHDPGRSGYRRCRHGKPLWCSTIHGDNDARLGQPLCEDCYDYTGHVLFAWHAPELWRRFTISLRRLLDSHQRAMGEAANSIRINYVKVAEMQRRAIPHFHAVIRLDGPPVPGEAPTPPVSSITATDLAVLVQRAARAVTLTVTDPERLGDGEGQVVRFGTQTDTQPLEPNHGHGRGEPPRPSGRSVAAYLAKYVTKSVAEFGVGIRRMSPLALTELDVTAHVRAILTTITGLAGHRPYDGMDRWLHTLGYRGHITTKSRLFSTTMGTLRAYRATWTRQQQADHAATTKDAERRRATSTSDAVDWEFDRVGLCGLGERVLILSAAQRMIEHRYTARDNLRAHDPPARPDWTT